MKKILFVAFFAAFAGLVACSDDDKTPAADPHAGASADCSAIAEACHPLDTGEGAIHDCHEIGHGKDTAKCTEKKAECLQTCVASDASAGDASHDDDHDHEEDASSDHT